MTDDLYTLFRALNGAACLAGVGVLVWAIWDALGDGPSRRGFLDQLPVQLLGFAWGLIGLGLCATSPTDPGWVSGALNAGVACVFGVMLLDRYDDHRKRSRPLPRRG